MSRAARSVPVALWALWGLYAMAMFATLPLVPFHPDEATHIYLSQDFDRLVWQLNPAGVTWLDPNTPAAVRRYRLLEAPLSRYLIGLSRALTGQHTATVAADWNWSATWAANAAAGALPSDALLWAARLPAAAGTVLGALLVFAIGRRAGGLVAGVSAAGLYAVNGALWLHGRRALSEGLTVFTMLLALWLLLRLGRRAAGLGAGVALAAAAKLTGVALLPAALLAVGLNYRGQRLRPVGGALAGLLVSFVAVSWCLNPALWADPLGGLANMATARAQLLAGQTAALRAAGGQVVDSPAQQATALLYHLYLAPLTFWELPNYAAATAPAEARYQALPFHMLFRAPQAGANLVPGAVLLTLTLAGLALNAWRCWRPAATHLPPAERRALFILATATLGLTAALFAIHIAWQRYYLPLLPLVCLWSGLGLAALARPLTQRWSGGRRT